jgi:hypothetical protein
MKKIKDAIESYGEDFSEILELELFKIPSVNQTNFSKNMIKYYIL